MRREDTVVMFFFDNLSDKMNTCLLDSVLQMRMHRMYERV